MLDTNVCVDLLRRRSVHLFDRIRQHGPDEIAISSITLAELLYGAEKSARPEHHVRALAEICAPLDILPFGYTAAERYGQVRVELERRGTPVGPLDTLIASHALSLGLILVTNNEREFRRIPGLKVENWLTV
jgi:tRNA(fMet)-specific endonuclease VapC